MNRKEQINEAVNGYSNDSSNYAEWDDCGYVYDDKDFIEQAFIEGANWADRTMIDKACEWFENVDFEMTYIDSEGLFDKEQFINDFRKAMEEEL